jgi:adenosylcobalamin-dependent ribonucleoside-triphosphate reductase
MLEIHKILNLRANKKLRPIDCLDIMNIVGSVVVSGNVRRSAQIAIGDHDDIEFLKSKRWDLGNIPNWRSMSNNSIVVPDNFDDIPHEFWETYNQGEPFGLINLELSKKVGRAYETQYPDPDIEGYNPCGEQSLANYETCCLSEVFLPNIEDYAELIEVLTFSYRMNKHSLNLSCTLKETENIVHKNMRMGIGMTGILQATEEQVGWLNNAYSWLRDYDKWYSDKNGFPRSIKLTTIKPSGTLSLLAGITPGVHPNPAGPYYVRRIRISSQSPLVNICKNNGYPVEYQKQFDGTDDKSTIVISFPCKVSKTTPIAATYGWRQQLDMVRRMQKEWSDNSVSCTVYYEKEDLPEIKEYLKKYLKDEIKSISFLLYHGHGFLQAPYETITKEQYEEMISKCTPITSVEIKEDHMELIECENGSCPIK